MSSAQPTPHEEGPLSPVAPVSALVSSPLPSSALPNHDGIDPRVTSGDAGGFSVDWELPAGQNQVS